MASPREKVSSIDPIWTALRQQAEAMVGREPTLAGFVHATILQHDRLEQALSAAVDDAAHAALQRDLSHRRTELAILLERRPRSVK